jgi:hypothetical protein
VIKRTLFSIETKSIVCFGTAATFALTAAFAPGGETASVQDLLYAPSESDNPKKIQAAG